ncbi:MAG TPA: PQQ-binding-like beta-propeller repeat protein [Gemmataceae bacterium]
MEWSPARRRRNTLMLGAIAPLLLVGVGVAVFLNRDRERRCEDAEGMRKLALLSLPGPAPAANADWPQWRGPNRDGVSPETSLRTDWSPGGPRVLWKQVIGRGFSSVAIVGTRLFTTEEETIASPDGEATGTGHEAVVCRDVRSGAEVWRFHYPNDYSERFGSGPRSTPAVDGDRIYAVGPTGIFHCLRADTGERLWRHDLLEEFHGRTMQYGVSFSPLVEGDLVYATPGGPDGNAVVAFDKVSGRVVWKALDDPMGYSSPIAVTAAGVRQLLVLTNEALVSLSPTDGKVYWRYPWKTANGFNIATPLAFGDYVLISSAYGKGCALLEIAAERDGSLCARRVYEHNRLRNYFASSIRWGNHLYGFDEKDLVCMDLHTGVEAWREKGIRSFGKGSLLAAAGHLIVLGESGTLWLIEATPAGYREKASCRVSTNKCWTVPVLADGKLYVRDESHLVCLDVRN